MNLLTSAIARMNMFLHDIEEFDVLRGDTLAEPKFIENDRLKQFDVIFANPPYSIKNGIVTSLPPIHMVVIFTVYHRRAALIMLLYSYNQKLKTRFWSRRHALATWSAVP